MPPDSFWNSGLVALALLTAGLGVLVGSVVLAVYAVRRGVDRPADAPLGGGPQLLVIVALLFAMTGLALLGTFVLVGCNYVIDKIIY